ncbi:sugar ABC transporter permeases protein [[Actinomadura] parvosata subsp. kistnae]|uniref:Sugar ABC transporter permease n=2 Tax=Nonomuraea TaxID=83681 RepID=A0A1U9ZYA0_9ACTN|nr:sugar ABC transporter permease [Nonomuraea sp. ATCC 55076]AQZ62910.1 sugar ABC transporter permease [Nonomuraea sp. ATCC 55076]SPL95798.1 sugar ABC transporter permeases protein [Actinomadura parvosata subsp. kistnae]
MTTTAPARPAAGRSRRPSGRRAARWPAWRAFLLLTLPMVAGLFVFKYVAIGWGFLLSFNDARGTIALGDWNGLDNYRRLLGDPAFTRSLVTILLFTLFIVPVTFALSLGLAVLVNRLRRGRALFRTTFFIPAAVSYVVGALVWKMSLFSGTPSGVANSLAYLLGHDDAIGWVAAVDPPLYWIVLVTVRLWLQTGFYMILFLAGIQQIPAQLYEAARVDGAESEGRLFRHITWPMLRNTSVAVVLLLIINAFQAFDEFYNILASNLSGLGRADGRTPLIYLFQTALGEQNYGAGSAGAFVVTMLIVVFTLLQGRFAGFGRTAEEEG